MSLNQSLALSPNHLISLDRVIMEIHGLLEKHLVLVKSSRISSSRGVFSDSGGSSSYSTQTIDSQQGIGITVRLSVESYRPGECGPQWFMKSQQFNCSSESQYSKFENHSLSNDSDNSKVALSNLPVNYAHHRTDITQQQSKFNISIIETCAFIVSANSIQGLYGFFFRCVERKIKGY